MIPAESQNLAESNPRIRVAIVCGPATNNLADSIEGLLGEAEGFTCSRIECHSECDVHSDVGRCANSDIVVATLGAFDAATTGLSADRTGGITHRGIFLIVDP